MDYWSRITNFSFGANITLQSRNLWFKTRLHHYANFMENVEYKLASKHLIFGRFWISKKEIEVTFPARHDGVNLWMVGFIINLENGWNWLTEQCSQFPSTRSGWKWHLFNSPQAGWPHVCKIRSVGLSGLEHNPIPSPNMPHINTKFIKIHEHLLQNGAPPSFTSGIKLFTISLVVGNYQPLRNKN